MIKTTLAALLSVALFSVATGTADAAPKCKTGKVFSTEMKKCVAKPAKVKQGS